MTATMAWKVVGSVFVLRERAEAPSMQEWRSFLAAFSQYRAKSTLLKILIATDGGGPDAEQRTYIKGAIAGRPFLSAVVSDSIKIRFIASAIMLINKNHRSFTTLQVARACDHLSLTPEERVGVGVALNEMTKALDARPSLWPTSAA